MNKGQAQALQVAAVLAGALAGSWLLKRSYDRAKDQGLDPSCPPRGTQLLMFGDSFAVGLEGPMLKLATKCQTAILIDAVSGSTSFAWAKQVEALLAEAQPTATLISLGGNELHVPQPEQLRRAIERIATQVKAYGPLIWIEPLSLPFEDRAGALTMWRKTADLVFDSAELDLPRYDNVHPLPSGFALWADELWLATSQWLHAR